MTVKLQEAIGALDKLPANVQNKEAEIILDGIAWQVSLDESQTKLSLLAHEALANGFTYFYVIPLPFSFFW